MVVITLVQHPTRFAQGQKELFLREWRPPPHQRLALVVHNPAELLGGPATPWLPAQLLQHAVSLLPEQQSKEQRKDSGGEQPPAVRRSRRLAAAAGNKVSSATTPLTLPPALQLLALSPNVAAYTAHMVHAWADSVLTPGPGVLPLDIPWLPPLVPWQPSSSGGAEGGNSSDTKRNSGAKWPVQHICMQASRRCGCSGPGCCVQPLACSVLVAQADLRTFRLLCCLLCCLQGSIDPHRRDYKAAFAAAVHPAVLSELRSRGEALLLVGQLTPEGPPPVPEALRPHVRVLSGLAFKVGLLHKCLRAKTWAAAVEASVAA